jgi:D-alanyl-D-alanine carboxypeptidase/D-alanyl-D-alanine-endopeptidase (penicillin-binding protein 4)
VVVSPSIAGQDAHIHLFPQRADVPVKGKITTSEKGKEFSISTKKHDSSGMEVTLGGIVKPNAKPRYVYRQVWEPVTNAAESFRFVLEEAGIEADFSVVIGKVDAAKADLILSFDSEPLSEMIRGMFKYSNNFTAEMIFLMLAAQSSGKQANWKTAAQIVENWWKERFPESGEITVINGSGMGSKNQCSANQLADLLGWSANENWFFEYITMLPIAGIDGTLSMRFKNSDLKGNLRAKTGTLNDLGVSSLAGYFRINGELYSMVFIANDRATAQYAKWVLSENLVSGIKKAIEKTKK